MLYHPGTASVSRRSLPAAYLSMSKKISIRQAVTHPKYKTISAAAKILYIQLCRWHNVYVRNQDNNNWYYRSTTELMDDTGLTKPTINKAKAELKLVNVIEIHNEHRQHSKTYYRVQR